MNFLRSIRSRSRSKVRPGDGRQGQQAQVYDAGQRWSSYDPSKRLPEAVVTRIMQYVCPHSMEESYDSAEDSTPDDGCLLCDMRDLAHCALACRRWAGVARDLLYHSVRIDAVHYCVLELELAEKRKHRSFFERNADPQDVPRQRLALFARTVRANEALAVRVQFLKVAYMTREGSKPDLARTVSCLPNLLYVDLPSGFFADEASCVVLKAELQAQCPAIRKMRYAAGSEASFAQLAAKRYWPELELLELAGLDLSSVVLVRTLATLPMLQDLKFEKMPDLDDTVFTVHQHQQANQLPGGGLIPGILFPPPAVFPPVATLSLLQTPNVTVAGLVAFLARPAVVETLSSLTLSGTAILPTQLHLILAQATHLTHLSITETVAKPVAFEAITAPLASRSLLALHYEITSVRAAAAGHGHGHGHAVPAASYYHYLAQSLHAHALPALLALYVRDPDFAEQLVLSPPRPAFAHHHEAGPGPGPAASAFPQQLDVFTKGVDEVEWAFTCVTPAAPRISTGPGGAGGFHDDSLQMPPPPTPRRGRDSIASFFLRHRDRDHDSGGGSGSSSDHRQEHVGYAYQHLDTPANTGFSSALAADRHPQYYNNHHYHSSSMHTTPPQNQNLNPNTAYNYPTAFLRPGSSSGGGGSVGSGPVPVPAAARSSLPPGWAFGGEGRHSVLVSDGTGGFAAAPSPLAPASSGSGAADGAGYASGEDAGSGSGSGAAYMRPGSGTASAWLLQHPPPGSPVVGAWPGSRRGSRQGTGTGPGTGTGGSTGGSPGTGTGTGMGGGSLI
ncbi:MAG: hypothetical protein M1826_001820 [Phylliscum demangeonii]|nr:MAG: hypothetical protein M1826_001820 [Phylliscum demangeonii]